MNKENGKDASQGRDLFHIGDFRSEDAEGIVRLFQAVYGSHYPIRLFYDAAAVVKANEEQRYHSIVARAANGDVIGVTHLYNSAPYPALYEWGVGLVLNECRSMGVNQRLGEFVHNEFIPRHAHMEEIFGEPVCNHTHMQKHVSLCGYVETGLEVALMPAEAYDQEKSASGRVATVTCFLCCRSKPQRVYLPVAYERELRTIYARLDDRRDLALSDADVPGSVESRIDLTVFDFAQVARIAVTEIGADFRERLLEKEKEAAAANVVVFQVWLDLTKPWVGEAAEELRKAGYFFGGMLPRWLDGDALLMQRLVCEPDFGDIKLYTDFSKELLAFVQKDWGRVAGW